MSKVKHPKFKRNGTRVSFHTESVGPRFDPYSRDTLTVERLGHTFTFVSCALAGDRYERDGQVVVDFAVDESEAWSAFTRDAGAEPGQYEQWYRQRIYQPDPYGELCDWV